ncbi:MAG: hypothetical protein U0R44_06875 [Candidatus Micrarchaeia archaeon]
MVELGTKIKKKIYRFELKKKYQYVSHYRKKERPPIEVIKDQFKKLLSPKKEPEKKAEQTFTSEPPKGGFNFLVFGGFLAIALIIVMLGILYLTTQVLAPGGSGFPNQLDKPSIENSITEGQILTAGDRSTPKNAGAVLVDFRTSNIVNYTINITTFDEEVPSEVFILNSERVEADSYPDFIRVLRSNLAKRQIILNEITLKQLETIPEGALVIVPSGAIPKEILGFNSLITMDRLAEHGVVVVYIGQPFTQMLNGTTTTFTPANTINNLPVKFDQNTPMESTGGFHLFQPLYRAIGSSGWQGSVVYGSVSVVKRGSGAFVFVPQTLDGGWRGNYSSAAEDISRIVFETPWAEPNAPTKTYVLANQTNYTGSRYFFSEAFESPKATLKVEFTGYSNTSNFPIRQTLYAHLEKSNNNSLFVESGGRVVPTNITGDKVRLNAQMREAVSAQPNMLLSIVDINGTELQTLPQGNVNIQADRSFDIPIYIDRGEYIVKLVDDESRNYAQSYMKVVSIDVNWTGINNQKRSIYNFVASMDGTPRSLSDVSVVVDDGRFGSYQFNNVDRMSVDVGQFTGGEELPYGPHNFTFTSGQLKVVVPVERTKSKTFFDDPIFWIVIILTGGIVGIGAVFARQESVFFSIDIPDFPPVARTRIPLNPEAILGLFQKVNENYRWQNTPLTSAEIKNGFKDIFVGGKPIIITDYNVEFILEELEKRGKVKESLGYYGLLDWEGRSKHPMEYLAIMRRVRDICVNNAIPFTGIDDSPDADSIITVVGQQMSLHFYSKGMEVPKLIGRALPTIGKGIAIILFKNQADKAYLQNLINSSPTVGPLILKMETDSSSLLFLTTDELEKMLMEFKSM